ncbi:hypothetical protein ANN_00787 [Periplaneta americana]|uniref:RNase H type-1 domain-containing protein n=1 Tax=Periplaneta americana TaxID=6978 RepID=A0ABQ8TU68_PERAM|nr:hypothetical protein ANN_00787 [Periplaneta americana]
MAARETRELAQAVLEQPSGTVRHSQALEQLELLQQLQDVRKSAAIHTDSRITLDSLRNFNNHHHLIEQIRKQIRKLEILNWTIHFSWVKAHVGLAGNELADHLEKQAASNNELPVSFDRIPISDIMRELQEESVVKWESEWKNTRNGAVTKSFFPSVKERLRVNIPLNGKVTTFLTGHGKTGAYLYRFKLRDNPSCACGAEEQTVDHLLFECPKLDKERLAFQREMLRKTGKWTFTKLKIMQEHVHTFINYVIIIIIILHELGLCRPVSAPSSSLLKGLPVNLSNCGSVQAKATRPEVLDSKCSELYEPTEKQTDEEKDRIRNRPTDGDRPTEKQTDEEKDRIRNRQSETDRPTERDQRRNRPTQKQADEEVIRPRNKLTNETVGRMKQVDEN